MGLATRGCEDLRDQHLYTLRRRIASGDLPAVKLGYKLIRVRTSDLDRLFPAIPTTRPEDRYRAW